MRLGLDNYQKFLMEMRRACLVVASPRPGAWRKSCGLCAKTFTDSLYHRERGCCQLGRRVQERNSIAIRVVLISEVDQARSMPFVPVMQSHCDHNSHGNAVKKRTGPGNTDHEHQRHTTGADHPKHDVTILGIV